MRTSPLAARSDCPFIDDSFLVSDPSRSSTGPGRQRYGLVCVLIACLLVSVAASNAFAQQRWNVSSRDGLVSVFANAATAADLAAALGNATGVNVVVHGEPSTPLSAEIVDEPLDKAVALLAPSHMLVRDGDAMDADIIEVVLMMPDPDGGSGGSTEFLPSGEPADGVVSDIATQQGTEAGALSAQTSGAGVDAAPLRGPNRAAQRQAASQAEALAIDAQRFEEQNSDLSSGAVPLPE